MPIVSNLILRYTGELAYPQLSMESSSQLHLVPGTQGMKLRNSCFIILVAGHYLQDFVTVMNKTDSLRWDMKKVAYAVFVLGDLPSTEAETYRHHTTPAVVSTGVLP